MGRALVRTLVSVVALSTGVVAFAAQPRDYPSFPDAVTEPPPWNDANPPFDLAGFLKATPPEKNASPLYLDALFEFEGSMGYCFVPKGVQESQYQGDVLQRYQTAREREKELYRFNQVWEKDHQDVDTVAVDACLARYDVGFQKLEAAQRRQKCVFQTGLSYGEKLPQATACQVVARVIQWRTRRDLQRGNLDRPIQDLKTLLRLSRDMGPRGTLLCQNVSIALEEDACRQLVLPILAAPEITVEYCDRMLALLVEHEAAAVDCYSEAYRAEYYVARSVLHDFQHHPGSFQAQYIREVVMMALEHDRGQEYLRQISAMTDDDYAKEVDILNRHVGAVLALEDQATVQRLSKLEMLAESMRRDERETTFLQFLVPDLKPFMYTLLRLKPTLGGTQCLVALRRWQLEHAELPEDLETLVKAVGLRGVPIDPWSGHPLLMAIVEGKPVVYSVGPDRRDDGAQSECKEPTQSGDFVFRLGVPSQ